LGEDSEKPHEWEDPGNARGKVSVHMHGYPGGYVKTLITAIEAGLFVHYTPQVVICQIGGNDCSNNFFDEKAFDLDTFIDACLTRGVSGIVFMSVLKRSKPQYCSSDEYTSRQEIVNRIMKNKAVAH